MLLLAKRVGDRHAEGSALLYTAKSWGLSGVREQAIEASNQAMALFRAIDDKVGVEETLNLNKMLDSLAPAAPTMSARPRVAEAAPAARSQPARSTGPQDSRQAGRPSERVGGMQVVEMP